MRSLQRSEERLRLAIEAAQMSVWEWDPVNRIRRSSGIIDEIATSVPSTLESFFSVVHPDDRDRVRDAITRSVTLDVPYDPEYRIVNGDGSVIWLATRGRMVKRGNGPAVLAGVAMDVTKRKMAEAALIESEARFRSLADALPQIVFTSSSEGRIDYVNQRWIEFTGLSEEETIAGGDQRVVHPDDLPTVQATWAAAQQDGQPWEYELRIRHVSGRYCWFLSRVVPVRDTDGRIAKWFGTSTDIDERKRTEEALARSERLFRSLAAATAQVIWTVGPEGRAGSDYDVRDVTVSSWNAFTGQTDPETEEFGWMDVVHPDDIERTRAIWNVNLTKPEPFAVEYRIRRHDGQWRNVIDRAVPVLDEDGRIESWIGTLTDVTDARLAEREVERGNARLRRIFDANVVGACVWNGEFVVEANDAFLAMVGASREQLETGRLSWREITPLRWATVDERATDEMRESGSTTFEKSYRRPDGTEVPVLLASALFSDSINEGIALVIDLSDRKERERFEQEFLAGVAHDLKNPLAAMKAQTQLMRRRLHSGRLSESTAEDGLAAIEHNVGRVTDRLEELMDVALLRAGHTLELRRMTVDLVALAQDRAQSYGQSTDRHRILVDEPGEAIVGGWDPGRLERVIDNLLSNAIKYSPNGGDVRVRLWRDHDESGSWAMLEVADEGIGIPAADLPHIFERTRRATNVRAIAHGAGVGLAGVRQLVELHGGTIAVESAEGAGSRFIVRLPVLPKGQR